MITKRISTLKVHPKTEYLFDNIEGTKWEEFLNSVREYGVMTPLTITPDGTIISGYQRYRACKELGIPTVQCEVTDFPSADAEIMALIHANIVQRGVVNFPSVKLGRLLQEVERITGTDKQYGRSTAGGPSKADFLQRIGVDRKVANCAKSLANMPESVQELVADGVVAPRVAYDVLGSKTKTEQERAADMVKKQYNAKKRCTLYDLKAITEPEQNELTAPFTITHQVGKKTMTLTLTEQEAEAVATEWLKRNGISLENTFKEPESKAKEITTYHVGVLDKNAKAVIAKYESGESSADIASQYRVCKETVLRFLKRNGVEIRPRGCNLMPKYVA